MSERIKKEIRKGLKFKKKLNIKQREEKTARKLFKAKRGHRVRWDLLRGRWVVEPVMIVKDKRKAKKIAKGETLF